MRKPDSVGTASLVGEDAVWVMMAPVTVLETIRQLRDLKDGAPGPDHRRKGYLLNLRAEAIACRFNIWMLTGIALTSLNKE